MFTCTVPLASAEACTNTKSAPLVESDQVPVPVSEAIVVHGIAFRLK